MSIPTAATEPRRLVIVLWSADPGAPGLAAAPFVYALAARALDVDVEMHYTARSVRWLVPGVADRAHTDHARTKTVLDYLRETRDAGVRHYACAMAMREHGAGRVLVPEAEGVAGAASVVGAAMDEGVRVMVF